MERCKGVGVVERIFGVHDDDAVGCVWRFETGKSWLYGAGVIASEAGVAPAGKGDGGVGGVVVESPAHSLYVGHGDDADVACVSWGGERMASVGGV